MEHGIGKIAAIETRALADREDVDAQIESLENSVVALRVLMERYAERGGHSVSAEALAASTVAKPSGRLAFDLRADEILRDLRRVK